MIFVWCLRQTSIHSRQEGQLPTRDSAADEARQTRPASPPHFCWTAPAPASLPYPRSPPQNHRPSVSTWPASHGL
ncbi:uncharacterized protein B0I36DRAFT_340448, partial [Microdochium trichocladiopsis]